MIILALLLLVNCFNILRESISEFIRGTICRRRIFLDKLSTWRLLTVKLFLVKLWLEIGLFQKLLCQRELLIAYLHWWNLRWRLGNISRLWKTVNRR